jgi:hypothetical protein
LLTFQSLLAGASLCLAAVAFLWARRLSVRLERLSQSYWELRYEQGQLSARLAALEQPPGPAAIPGDQRMASPTAFVPLSSLRK